MGNIVVFNFVTLDGYFAGVNEDIDWHTVDDEFNKFAVEFIGQCDTAIFGRTTYDLFAGFWPNEDDTWSAEDRFIGKALTDMHKVVLTHKDLQPSWQNTDVWHELSAQKVQELKEQSGKNIVIYGSGTVVKQLTDMGLIDEYHIIVAPVILGAGKTLFEGSQQKTLHLLDTKTFTSGNVLIKYTIEAPSND